MEINPLIPIGTKIKVDKSKIENMISQKILDELPQLINGEIVDYKMTDGMGIGYVLMTENNLKIWIFSTELNEQTRREFRVEETNTSNNHNYFDLVLGKYKVGYDINGNKNIKMIANPMNLVKWLLFTLKDIL